jgi:predicted neutral ceramidase superfamily lipid hydrolase
LLSLVIVLALSVLVLDTEHLTSIWYRVIIAAALQLSIVVEVSDRYLKRSTGRISKLDSWLGRALDRLGMMILFVSFGFAAWRLNGNPLFIYLGIATGYVPSLYSLAIATWEFSLLDEKSTPQSVRAVAFSAKIYEKHVRKRGSSTMGCRILHTIRCFLNPGTDERPLLLSVFVLIGRIDIMLGVAALLSCAQTVKVYLAVRAKSRVLSVKTNGKIE